MSGFPFKCKHCGKPGLARTSTRGQFCNKKCFGLSRRKNRTAVEKKEIKRLYDVGYRARQPRQEYLEKKKTYYFENHEHFLRKMKIRRRSPEYKAFMSKYLGSYWTPELKSKKKDYDRKFRAQKAFGQLWELHYLTVLLNEEVKSRMSNYEIRFQNGTLNKTQRRIRNGEVKRGYS